MNNPFIIPITITAAMVPQVNNNSLEYKKFDTNFSDLRFIGNSFTNPVEFDHTYSLKERINVFKNFKENWDGYNGVQPSSKVIYNSIKFIDCLSSPMLSKLNENYITPTPYGTIVIDFKESNNVVSVEIGETKIGFFTELEDYDNTIIENKNFNENIFPKELIKAFKQLYKSEIG